MAWLRAKKGYDRERTLAEARHAAGRGKHTTAAALYEKVSELEPDNADVLRRLTAQRARAGQREVGWRDCRRAAEHLAERGFVEQAIGVCRDFAHYVPSEVGVWQALSDLEQARGRDPDAVQVLIEGRKWFRGRRGRGDAIALLHLARKIDPVHFEANFDLACLLLRDGASAQALRVLEGLEMHARGRNLRRLRGRMFRLAPGPGTAWRWLVALLRLEGGSRTLRDCRYRTVP